MYNSDGYVLIDMSGVDMTASTQHVSGLFNRITKDAVGCNKLAVVINAGELTPMAAVINRTLNYYVVTTSLYIFKINTNDILIIEESGEVTVDVTIIPTLESGVKVADFAIGSTEGSIYAPAQQSEINDTVTASNTTWSSDKISTQLSAKANSADLATVATSGAYSDLSGLPTIPTKTSQLDNDSGFITSAQVPTIDDSTVSSTSVWSSYKTSAELGNKANSSDVYDKTSIDNALALKANAADVYTKTEVNTALADKANKSDVDNSTITINRKTGVPNTVPIPTVTRRGHVVIISFAHELPSGTYTAATQGGTWEINPKPIYQTFSLVSCNGTPTVTVRTDGTIGFNGNNTLNNNTYIIGELVYITAD